MHHPPLLSSQNHIVDENYSVFNKNASLPTTKMNLQSSNLALPIIDFGSHGHEALPKSSSVQEVFVAPCRARGMGSSHNFNTAYFRISSQTGHKTELLCTHSRCRADGIKFCYCSTCRVPVAKRNFKNRHSHRKAAAMENSTMAMNTTSKLLCMPIKSFSTKTNQKTQKEASIGSIIMGTNPNVNSANDAKLHLSEQLPNESFISCGSPDDVTTMIDNSFVPPPRQWTELYYARPHTSNVTGMYEWIEKIIMVSNPEKDPKDT